MCRENFLNQHVFCFNYVRAKGKSKTAPKELHLTVPVDVVLCFDFFPNKINPKNGKIGAVVLTLKYPNTSKGIGQKFLNINMKHVSNTYIWITYILIDTSGFITL